MGDSGEEQRPEWAKPVWYGPFDSSEDSKNTGKDYKNNVL